VKQAAALLGALLACPIGILAQVATGPEVQVNPSHAGYHLAPAVGVAGDGSGLVIYDYNPGKDELRLLDRDGHPVGELQIFTPLDLGKGGNGSSLALGRGGRGVDCWSDANHGYCRPLDAGLGIVGEHFPVEDEERGNLDSWVALRGDAGIVVSWLRIIDYQVKVFVRFLTLEGIPESESIELASFPLNYALRAAVASLGPEEAVVVWNQVGADGDDEGIFGQRVRPSGSVGDRFVVNTYAQGVQRLPVISSDGSSRFVVAWEDWGRGVYAQRFDASGAKLGPEIRVSSNPDTFQIWPSISMDALGNFAVTFYGGQEAEDLAEDTFLRVFRSDGTPYGPQVLVNEQIIYEQEYGTVALSDAGLIQVAYQSWRVPPEEPGAVYDFDIMTRRFVLPCVEDAHTLCLGGGRFQVRAFWRDYAGNTGAGERLPLGDDSGGFTFFAPGRLEILAKIVDGCDYNQRFWLYAAGLTDVDVDLLVTDTWTGKVAMYSNPLGEPYLPVLTIDHFDTCAALAPATSPAEAPFASATGLAAPLSAVASSGSCVPDAATHCLTGGRFRLRAHWRDFAGGEGEGQALPFGDDSGLFWFFLPDNVELVVKVVDGCSFNNRFWVYASGLTNVAVELDVEDTESGLVWHRETGLGEAFPPYFDSGAFATCD